MSHTISPIVSAEGAARLEVIIGDRSRPLKHIQRACIIQFSAERLTVQKVARRASLS